ncbi:MAG: TrmO family methyltransferase, partial [Oscillospiraceae bacterium]
FVLHGRAVCTARKPLCEHVLRAPRVPVCRGGGGRYEARSPASASDFATTLGIPRQSGVVVGSLQAEIVFASRSFAAARLRAGLDGYSHIWLIWEFSENVDAPWSPTVRPPRWAAMCAWACSPRAPVPAKPHRFVMRAARAVDLTDPRGPVLHVAGADLMDGTPIFDIKPYIPYADCHPEATEGFTGQVEMQELTVMIPPELLSRFPADKRDALIGVLTQDPRPRYQTDASRVYGLEFGGYGNQIHALIARR